MFNNSPLESLAAFAIVFVMGVATAVGLDKYIARVKKDARSSVQ